MKKLLLVTTITLLLCNYGCGTGNSSFDLIDEFSIPQNAKNLKKLNLGSSDVQQLYYELTNDYPSNSQLVIYKEYLNQKGWISCIGPNQDWWSYEDRSGKNTLFVHQNTSYWITTDRKKMLLLSATYYSEKLVNGNPDNNTQRIILLVEKTDNLESQLKNLRVSCSSK